MNTLSQIAINRNGLEPQTHTLSNGKPLYLFPDCSMDVIRIDFTFEAGAFYQTKKLMAAAANQLFTEGTTHHSAQEIAEFIDFRGIIVEKSPDNYDASLSVYTLKKYVPELFPLLREILLFPTFPQREFDIFIAKRRQILQSNFQKTKYVARNLFYESLYGPTHPMGQYATPDDCDHLTVEEVASFFHTHYHLDQAQFIISGHYDDEIIALFDQYFAVPVGNFTPTPPLRLTQPPALQPTPPYHHSLANAAQTTLRVGCILPFAWDSKEYANFLVLNTIFGGYFGSRLMSNIREEKGYTYGINALTQIYRDSVVQYLVTDVGNNVADAALNEIYKEMQRLVDEPVPDDELEVVRHFMLGDFLRSIDGIFERAERFRQMTSNHCTERFADNYLEAVRTVTPHQLQALARQVFQRENMTEIVVGPQNE